MKLNNLSAKKICRLISAGMVFSMLVITGIFGGIMQDTRIFIAGGTLTLCAFFWIWLLVLFFGKRLSHFTSNLCRTLDNMIDGNEELQKKFLEWQRQKAICNVSLVTELEHSFLND